MKYESDTLIDGSAGDVWDVLINASEYSAWNSTVDRVDGVIEMQGKITVVAKVSPDRAFPVRVTVLDRPNRMVWEGGMPLGLFKGVRTFSLSKEGGKTRFAMREEFSGPMLKMISKTMPDLQPSFDQFAADLKARVEQG